MSLHSCYSGIFSTPEATDLFNFALMPCGLKPPFERRGTAAGGGGFFPIVFNREQLPHLVLHSCQHDMNTKLSYIPLNDRNTKTWYFSRFSVSCAPKRLTRAGYSIPISARGETYFPSFVISRCRCGASTHSHGISSISPICMDGSTLSPTETVGFSLSPE